MNEEYSAKWVKAAGSDPLPRGAYLAVFRGEEGQGWEWYDTCLVWEIATGPHAGRKAFAIVEKHSAPDNRMGWFVARMLGRGLSADEDLFQLLPQVVGRRFVVVVDLLSYPDGLYPRVTNVMSE